MAERQPTAGARKRLVREICAACRPCERRAVLPTPPGTHQRHQTMSRHQPGHIRQITLTTDEFRQRHRQPRRPAPRTRHQRRPAITPLTQPRPQPPKQWTSRTRTGKRPQPTAGSTCQAAPMTGGHSPDQLPHSHALITSNASHRPCHPNSLSGLGCSPGQREDFPRAQFGSERRRRVQLPRLLARREGCGAVAVVRDARGRPVPLVQCVDFQIMRSKRRQTAG